MLYTISLVNYEYLAFGMNSNSSFSEFVASSNFWAWETDSALRMTYVSPNFEELSGIPERKVMGVSRLDMLDRAAVPGFLSDHRDDLLAHRPFRSFRLPVITGENGDRVRWFESSGTPRFDEAGNFLGYRGIARDMTDDRRSTEQLELAGREIKISEAVFHHVERIAKIGAWKLEMPSGDVEWSEEIYRIYELDPNTPIDLETAMAPYTDEAREALQSALARTTTSGEPFDIILPFITPSKEFRWVRSLGEAEIIDGRTVKLFGTFQDVTEERNRQNEMRRLAETDHLTGIANRTTFQDFTRQAIADAVAESSVGALCLIDLDQFKQTNDHFGHAAGDAVLKATSEWLKSLAKSDSHVARLGGDEFAMIITGYKSAEAIEAIVNERFSTLHHKIDFQGRALEIRASVGFAIFSEDDSDLEELMANADLALYDAKTLGRRKISKYQASFGSKFARKMGLISEFKAALTKREIVPYYQPIVELATNRVSGFEALARWNHPTKGVLTAGAFFEVFENQELVADIGELMISSVMQDMGKWKKQGVPFGRVGVNVTDANLLEPGFPLSISSQLGRNQLLPQQLIFEITENTVFKSKKSIVEVLTNLQSLGVLIALDDFGTGFSSLTHLQDIPFDILKIDKSFTQRIDHSAASREIVRSLVTLGISLGYTTVAEGIETEADAEGLKSLGCERAQGFYFARPMPASDVLGYVSDLQIIACGMDQVAS